MENHATTAPRLIACCMIPKIFTVPNNDNASDAPTTGHVILCPPVEKSSPAVFCPPLCFRSFILRYNAQPPIDTISYKITTAMITEVFISCFPPFQVPYSHYNSFLLSVFIFLFMQLTCQFLFLLFDRVWRTLFLFCVIPCHFVPFCDCLTHIFFKS